MDNEPKPTTRAQVAALLTEASFTAQREFPVVGTVNLPTPWDHCHALLDALLYRWEALAPGGRAG